MKVTAGHHGEIAAFLAAVGNNTVPVSAIGMVAADGDMSALPDLVRGTQELAKGSVPKEDIGAAVSTFFADMNTAQAHCSAMTMLACPMSPQVHACDDDSVMRNVAGQGIVVRTIRDFAPEARVRVGPISLVPPGGPFAAGAHARPGLDENVDPRQGSLLNGAWTVGSMAELAQAGAVSATYFELTGQRGILMPVTSRRSPASFPYRAGAVFPVFHVLAFAAGAKQRSCAPMRIGAPQVIRGLAIGNGNGMRVLLANFTPRPVTVELTAAGFRLAGIALDEFSYADASESSTWSSAAQMTELDDRGGPPTCLLRPYAVLLLRASPK